DPGFSLQYALHRYPSWPAGTVALTFGAILLTVDAMRRPMVSLAVTHGLVEAIEAGGGNPDDVLATLKLTRAGLATPHGFIPSSAFAQGLEEAALATGDDTFGLHFGERYQPKNLGPLTYVVIHSPTIGAALENMGRYIRVHNEAAESSVVIEGTWALARLRLTGLTVAVPRQQHEFAMAVALNTLRLMAGSDWIPAEVHFAHPVPRSTVEHVRVFRAPVSFGHAANAFVLEPAFLDRQVPSADPRLYPILRQYLDRVLEEMPAEEPEMASIRRLIGEAMRHGEPKLAPVARALATSGRSLQRRLKEHGVDFRDMVEDTRRRFALHYLQDREHTVSEIAYLVGYSEVSAFNRAFKRWTGLTPTDFRRRA